MGFENFQDRMRNRRDQARRTYDANSDMAWEQIKELFTTPSHWIVGAIALLLIVAGVFTVKFVGAIRAPDMQKTRTPIMFGDPFPNAPKAGKGGEDAEAAAPEEEYDFSNTEQPLVDGARKEDYYTFLLLATDAGSSNTDTIMVVSYDVKNQKVNLMSIPRDTMVNVSWDIKKINSVYAMSGMNGLKKHIGKLVGFVPDFYVKVDLKAFIDVVDLIGGVDFEVPRNMDYDDPAQNLHIHYKAGMQHLTGQQAMEVVRWRKNNRSSGGGTAGYDDTGRIQTQQNFLRAALKQALSIRNWTKISGYVEIFKEDVDSDLPLENMLWFASKAMDLSESGFAACTIPGNYYASAWSRSTHSYQSYVTLYAKEVVKLVNESFNPYLTNVSLSNLDIMSINSDGSLSSTSGYVADSRAASAPAKSSSGASESSGKSDESSSSSSSSSGGDSKTTDAAAAQPSTVAETPAGNGTETPANATTQAGQTAPDPAAAPAESQTGQTADQPPDWLRFDDETPPAPEPQPTEPAPAEPPPALEGPAPVDTIPPEELANMVSGHGVTE